MENDKKKQQQNWKAAQVFHNFHFSFNNENLEKNGTKLKSLRKYFIISMTQAKKKTECKRYMSFRNKYLKNSVRRIYRRNATTPTIYPHLILIIFIMPASVLSDLF